ncbi:MAG: hypothetical protein A3A24_01485 [Candidatus Buchananbacteria bacterium RIFCSPLOWO2_01_FULL_46_12]|uniref:phosphoribosylamine--glycine ligase n=1 Tax=Candidatus Buchananbacteria bacterium RIFCSPLOWO2_01_FULL_46_12 TaxID=1797546 RepID=A0A1G1YV79_9BACT|nr:MAG: hypothetical protein A3A24_01485 [Candidatus Buchananbacteria bacterium RIFCSPLOWO2_01_FULL_46_12]
MAGILTADWAFFDVTNPSRALDFIRDNFRKGFRVIKAVGLCDGKGVTVGKTLKEAEEAIRDCLKRDKFGAAGRQILIEKKLKPRRGLVRGEFSMTVVTDGVDYQILLAAMDHKQVFDGDKGLNGGGSGAISHPDFVTAKVKRQFENDVLKPLLATLNNLKIKFKGVLYFGLMLTDRGPEVLEINVRFGDPECQVIMGMCQQGMGELLYRVATGQSIKDIKVKFHQGRAVYLIQMAEGYPGTVRRKGFQDGDIISGLEQVRPLKDIIFVHAGTTFSEKGRAIRTNGGRVTGIFCRRTGRRARELARQRTLAVVRMVNWPGQFHRTDIGEIGCEAA